MARVMTNGINLAHILSVLRREQIQFFVLLMRCALSLSAVFVYSLNLDVLLFTSSICWVGRSLIRLSFLSSKATVHTVSPCSDNLFKSIPAFSKIPMSFPLSHFIELQLLHNEQQTISLESLCSLFRAPKVSYYNPKIL